MSKLNEPFSQKEVELIRLFNERSEKLLKIQEAGGFKPLDRTILLHLVDDLEVIVRGK